MEYHGMQQKARMFEACVRLQSAASSLKRLRNEDSLDGEQIENLKWTGNLVGRLDWDAPDYPKGDFSSVLATSIRPYFYRAFIEMKLVPTRDFLNRLYQTLQTGTKSLKAEEIGLASELMKKMSGYINVRRSSRDN